MSHTKHWAEIKLEEATKLLEEALLFCPTEPNNNEACWFCDMGGAGYSTKGQGNHDNRLPHVCLFHKINAFLKKITLAIH